MKKTLALLMALAMSLSLLTACGSPADPMQASPRTPAILPRSRLKIRLSPPPRSRLRSPLKILPRPPLRSRLTACPPTAIPWSLPWS